MKRWITALLNVAVFIATLILVYDISPKHLSRKIEKKEHGTDNAMAALDFWTRARAYPDKDIPPDKYYQAYVAAKANAKKLPRSAYSIEADTTWQPIGPLNSYNHGRSISVAVDPTNSDIVYCGTASGGLWVSHTAGLGSDWARITLGYPALGISAIMIDPTDHNTIYLGTGEVYRYQTAVTGLVLRTTRGSYGVGILKTTDGGGTWTKSLDWTYNQERGIQQIKINPLNHKTLFTATTEGVYRSNDAGVTWTQVLSVLMATDILINANDTTQLLAACGNFNSTDYGLYRSINTGSSWSRISGSVSEYSGKTLLDAYPSNNNIVWASVADSTTGAGSLWNSTDFGGTWSSMQSYPPDQNGFFGVQGWYSHFVAIKSNDPSTIVHGGLYVIRSANGGVGFGGTSGGYSDNHNFARDPLNPNVLYIVNDNGIFRSTDFGINFTDVSGGMQTLQFYNGFSCSATDSTIAIGQSQDHIPGFLFQGTINWGRPSGTDEVGWTAIDQTNDNIMYAINRYGGSFYKSVNRGSSFSSPASFIQGAWNSPLVVSPINSNIIYAGTVNVYKS